MLFKRIYEVPCSASGHSPVSAVSTHQSPHTESRHLSLSFWGLLRDHPKTPIQQCCVTHTKSRFKKQQNSRERKSILLSTLHDLLELSVSTRRVSALKGGSGREQKHHCPRPNNHGAWWNEALWKDEGNHLSHSGRKQGGRKHPEGEASSLLWPGGSTGNRARCVKALTADLWMTALALGATGPHSTNSETLDTSMVIETGQNSTAFFLWMCHHQVSVGSRSHEVTSWEPLYPCQRVSLMSKWKMVYEGALRSRKPCVRMKWELILMSNTPEVNQPFSRSWKSTLAWARWRTETRLCVFILVLWCWRAHSHKT